MSDAEPPPTGALPQSSKPMYVAVATLAVLAMAGLGGLAFELSLANERVANVEFEVKALHEHVLATEEAHAKQLGKLHSRTEKLSGSIRGIISVRGNLRRTARSRVLPRWTQRARLSEHARPLVTCLRGRRARKAVTTCAAR